MNKRVSPMKNESRFLTSSRGGIVRTGVFDVILMVVFLCAKTTVVEACPPVGYVLTVDRVESGMITLTPPGVEFTEPIDAQSYAAGTEVSLEASPSSLFLRWEWKDSQGNVISTETVNPTTTVMDGNKWITAVFSHSFQPFVNHVNRAAYIPGQPTCNSTCAFGVIFSEDVVNVTVDDFELSYTGTLSGASVSEVIPWTADYYIINAATGQGCGLLGLDVKAGTDIKDLEENSLTLVPYTSGERFDVLRPRLTLAATGSGTLDPSVGVHLIECIDEVSVTATPDAGWAFSHWEGNASGSENPLTVVMDQDKSITAVFAISDPVYLTTAVVGEGTVTPPPDGGPYAYPRGQTAWVQAIESCADWQFDHWLETGSTANSAGISMTTDKTMTAVFLPNSCRIYAGANGPGYVLSTPPAQSYEYGSQVQLQAVPAPGWTFVQWSGDTTGIADPSVDTITFTVSGDRYLTAEVARIQYALTTNVTGSGSVTRDPSQGSYDSFEKVTLAPMAMSGHYFDHWEMAEGFPHELRCDDPLLVTMDAPKTVSAVFSPKPILNFTCSEVWTADPAPDADGSYAPGTTVTLRVWPGAGRYLTQWQGQVEAYLADPLTAVVKMDGSQTVAAEFVDGYVLTVNTVVGTQAGDWPGETRDHVAASPVPQLWDRPNTGQGQTLQPGQFVGHVEPLTSVHLTATLEPGGNQVFHHWEKSNGIFITRDAETTVQMDANQAVNAVYIDRGAQVTANVLGAGELLFGDDVGNPASASQIIRHYALGAAVSIHAVPMAGWILDHWVAPEGCDLNDVTGDLILPNTEDAVVSAIFIPEDALVAFQTDVDGNGTTDPADITVVRQAMGGSGPAAADINGDGLYDLFDLKWVIDGANGRNCDYPVCLGATGSGSVRLDVPGQAAQYFTSPQTIQCPANKKITLTALPESGSRLDFWTGDAFWRAISQEVRVTQPLRLTAHFVSIGAGENVTDADSDGVYAFREATEGTDPSDADSDDDGIPDGWELDHRTDPLDATGVNGSAGDIDGDGKTNLQEYQDATFPGAPVTPLFKFYLYKKGDGAVDQVPLKDLNPSGSYIDLYATPDLGWEFSGWEGDVVAPTKSMPGTPLHANTAVRAHFIPYCTVKGVGKGQGEVFLDRPDGYYLEGQEATVTAVPADGWEFDHWQTGTRGSGASKTVHIGHDTVFNAHFKRVSYPLTLQIDGAAQPVTVAVNGVFQGTYLAEQSPVTMQVPVNAEVSLAAVPDTANHWIFEQWVKQQGRKKSEICTDAQLHFFMTGSTQVTAQFRETFPVLFIIPAEGTSCTEFSPKPAFRTDNGNQWTLYYPARTGVKVQVTQYPFADAYVVWDYYGSGSVDPASPHPERYENPQVISWPDNATTAIGYRFLQAQPGASHEFPIQFLTIDPKLRSMGIQVKAVQEWSAAVTGDPLNGSPASAIGITNAKASAPVFVSPTHDSVSYPNNQDSAYLSFRVERATSGRRFNGYYARNQFVPTECLVFDQTGAIVATVGETAVSLPYSGAPYTLSPKGSCDYFYLDVGPWDYTQPYYYPYDVNYLLACNWFESFEPWTWHYDFDNQATYGWMTASVTWPDDGYKFDGWYWYGYYFDYYDNVELTDWFYSPSIYFDLDSYEYWGDSKLPDYFPRIVACPWYVEDPTELTVQYFQIHNASAGIDICCEPSPYFDFCESTIVNGDFDSLTFEYELDYPPDDMDYDRSCNALPDSSITYWGVYLDGTPVGPYQWSPCGDEGIVYGVAGTYWWEYRSVLNPSPGQSVTIQVYFPGPGFGDIYDWLDAEIVAVQDEANRYSPGSWAYRVHLEANQHGWLTPSFTGPYMNKAVEQLATGFSYCGAGVSVNDDNHLMYIYYDYGIGAWLYAIVTPEEVSAFLYGVFIAALFNNEPANSGLADMETLKWYLTRLDPQYTSAINAGINYSLTYSTTEAWYTFPPDYEERLKLWPRSFDDIATMDETFWGASVFWTAIDPGYIPSECEVAAGCPMGDCGPGSYVHFVIDDPSGAGVTFSGDCPSETVGGEVWVGPYADAAVDITIAAEDPDYFITVDEIPMPGFPVYTSTFAAGSVYTVKVRRVLEVSAHNGGVGADVLFSSPWLGEIILAPDDVAAFPLYAEEDTVEFSIVPADVCNIIWLCNSIPVGGDFIWSVNLNQDAPVADILVEFGPCIATHQLTLCKSGEQAGGSNTVQVDQLALQTAECQSYTLPEGSHTLVASPDQNHTFLGWYDGENSLSSSATYTYTLTQNKTITAKFVVKNLAAVTVFFQGKGSVLVEPIAPAGASVTLSGEDSQDVADTLQLGQKVRLTAIPDGTYFGGWSSNVQSNGCVTLTGDGLLQPSVYLCDLGQNTNVTASFALTPEDPAGTGLFDIFSFYRNSRPWGSNYVAKYPAATLSDIPATPEIDPCPPKIDFAYPGDPVFPFSGEFCEVAEDLYVRSAGPDFVFTRTYMSRNNDVTGFGKGWDYSYNISIEETSLGDPPDQPGLCLCSGNGRKDYFVRQEDPGNPGQFIWTRPEYFSKFTEANGVYTLTFQDGGVWEFGTLRGVVGSRKAKIAAIRDRNGHAMTFNHASDRTRATLCDGRSFDIHLDTTQSPPIIDYVCENFGDHRAVQYAYEDGSLAAVTNPAGGTTAYTYSQEGGELNGNLESITDARNNTYLRLWYCEDPSDINYDRVQNQQWGATGEDIHFTYTQLSPNSPDEPTTRTTITDRRGNQQILEYDGFNRGIKETIVIPGGANLVTTHQWDLNSLLKRVVHPNGGSTDYQYDTSTGRSNLISVTHRPGPGDNDQTEIIETFEYGDQSCGCEAYATKYLNGRRIPTYYEYENGNRIATLDHNGQPLENLTYYTDAARRGLVATRTGPDNGSGVRLVTQYEYDNYGYANEIIDGVNTLTPRVTTFVNDAYGNPLSITDPRGNTTSFVYDSLHRIATITQPVELATGGADTYQTSFTYDGNGNVTQSSRRSFSTPADEQVINYTQYNVLNLLMQTDQDIGAEHAIVQYDHDENGNLTVVRSPSAVAGVDPNNRREYEYDAADRLTKVIRGDGLLAVTYVYNDHGQLAYKIEGNENALAPDFSHPYYAYTYDGFGRLKTETDPVGTVKQYEYDANGQITDVVTEGAITGGASPQQGVLSHTHYEYDLRNRVVAKMEAFFDPLTETPPLLTEDRWAVTTYDYSDTSQVTCRTNANLRTTSYMYTPFGQVACVVRANGAYEQYEYDLNGNLTLKETVPASEWPLPNGEVFESTGVHTVYEKYDYDALNRLIRIKNGAPPEYPQYLVSAEFQYDSRSNMVFRKDYEGCVLRTAYNSADKPVSASHFSSASAQTPTLTTYSTWDINGRLTGKEDGKGNLTTYAYDAADRLTAVTPPGTLGQELFQYDAQGNLETYTDLNGTQISSTYDGLGRTTRRDFVTDGLATLLITAYEEYGYDGMSRVVQAENDVSRVIRQYDSLGNNISEQLVFKTANRPSSPKSVLDAAIGQKAAGITIIVMGQNPGGSVAWPVTPSWFSQVDTGHNSGFSTRYYANGVTLHFDAVPADGYVFQHWAITSWTYLGNNEWSSVPHALDGSTSPSIDANVTGEAFDFFPIFAPEAERASLVTHTYDCAGNRLSTTYPTSALWSMGTWQSSYNEINELKRLENVSLGAVDFYSFGPGQTRAKLFQNGASCTTIYSSYVPPTKPLMSAFRLFAPIGLENVFVGGSETVSYSQSYERNNNFNITSWAVNGCTTGEPPRVTTFAYDELGRITESATSQEGVPDWVTLSYQYDAAGNRVQSQISKNNWPEPEVQPYAFMDPDAVEFPYEASNAYAATPSLNIDSKRLQTYDQNGNTIRLKGSDGSLRKLSYDHRNRIVLHEADNWPRSWYFYDAFGRRIQKTVGNTTTRYVYDGDRIIEERDMNGNIVAGYAYGRGLDEPAIMCRDVKDANGNFGPDGLPEAYYIHTDALHSTYYLSDQQGELVEAYSYGNLLSPNIRLNDGALLAFPNDTGLPTFHRPDMYIRTMESNDSGLVQFYYSQWPVESRYKMPFLFQGRQWDPELSMYYFRNRYLDPLAGRFTTRDPLGAWTDSLNLGNPYTFVGNNPWAFTDPYGLSMELASQPERVGFSGYVRALAYGPIAPWVELLTPSPAPTPPVDNTSTSAQTSNTSIYSDEINAAADRRANMLPDLLVATSGTARELLDYATISTQLLGTAGMGAVAGIVAASVDASQGEYGDAAWNAGLALVAVGALRHSDDITGVAKPCVLPGSTRYPGSSLHHIVPRKLNLPGAERARRVLARWGIDLDDGFNTVILPWAEPMPELGMYHRSLHTETYCLALAQTLERATNREEAINYLYSIRIDLLEGTFPR